MGLKLEDEAICTHTGLAGIRSRSGGFNGSYKGLDSLVLVLVLGFEVLGLKTVRFWRLCKGFRKGSSSGFKWYLPQVWVLGSLQKPKPKTP